jgi:ATP-dependent Clp protease, protease subunit
VEKVLSISDKFVKAIEGGEYPVLKVSGVVGMDFTGMQLADAVEFYGQEGQVHIELDSMGGFVSDAFAFYDQVRTKGLKVSVDGYGMVASAATVILAAAGRKRSRLSPNAEYLVHNASGGDAEGLKRANKKMAAIYAELTGKDEKAILDLMKQDKAMGAEEARKWGFVGSVIELQKLAATADKTKNMEDNVKAKHAFKLTAQQILSAALGNEVEIEMDLNAEAATQLTAYAGEVKGLRTEVDELKAEVEAKDAAITAAATEVTKVQASAKEATERATKAEAEVAKLTAEVAKLKTTPIAEPIKAKGEEVVDPAAPADTTPKKLTAEERSKGMQARVSGANKTKV